MGGGGSTYDYGFRIYNPQIAKFLSVDPLSNQFVYFSPYHFAGNKPLWFIDLDGAEIEIPEFEKFKYGDNILTNAVFVFDNAFIDAGNEVIGFANSTVYVVHKVATNPSEIPSEIKSEMSATYTAVAVYAKNTYEYATKIPLKQQFNETLDGFKYPENYEASVGLAVSLFMTKSVKPAANTKIDGLIPKPETSLNPSEIKKTVASEEMVTMYRGVNENNVGYKNALNGVVVPNKGSATALEHNTISTINSPYSSWTLNKEVATNFALRPKGEGVILSKDFKWSSLYESPNLKEVNLKQSPGTIVSENEWLSKGKVSGCSVEKVKNP